MDIPILDALANILRTVGPDSSPVGGPYETSAILPNIFYVSAEFGSDTSDGRDPRRPKATITAAYEAAVSGRGDVIYVYPGSYDENIVANKDYVTIKGALDAGYAKPDIVPSTGKAVVNESGQGVILENLRCVSEDDDAVVLSGNGGKATDIVCEAVDGAALVLAAGNTDLDDHYTASEWKITRPLLRDSLVGLKFVNPGPGAEAQGGVGPTDVEIEDPTFVNNANEDILDEDTVGSNGSTFTRSRIVRPRFVTPKDVYVDLSNGANNDGILIDAFVPDAGVDENAIVLAAGVIPVAIHSPKGEIDTTAW